MNMPNFEQNPLIPAIIQDNKTGRVRMLGFMNHESWELTKASGKVHFFSRSKNRIWMKGETSGNLLSVCEMFYDCDADAILILSEAQGPTCHKGTESCFGEEYGEVEFKSFLYRLEKIIHNRWNAQEDKKSYTRSLKEKGIAQISRKVGEEAIETIIEAMKGNSELFLQESADLIFHWLVLMKSMGCRLEDLEKILKKRHYEGSEGK